MRELNMRTFSRRNDHASFFDAYSNIPQDQRNDISVSRVQSVLLCRLVLRYAVKSQVQKVPTLVLNRFNFYLPGQIPDESQWLDINIILGVQKSITFTTYYSSSDDQLVFEYM